MRNNSIAVLALAMLCAISGVGNTQAQFTWNHLKNENVADKSVTGHSYDSTGNLEAEVIIYGIRKYRDPDIRAEIHGAFHAVVEETKIDSNGTRGTKKELEASRADYIPGGEQWNDTERGHGTDSDYGKWVVSDSRFHPSFDVNIRDFKIWMVFYPNYDKIRTLAPNESIEHKITFNEWPKNKTWTAARNGDVRAKASGTITITGEEILSSNWNQMQAEITGGNSVASYPDVEGSVTFQKLGQPSDKLHRLAIESFETTDLTKDPTSFESCTGQNTDDCWRWGSSDVSESVSGLSGITGMATQAGNRNTYGTWIVPDMETESMSEFSRQVVFRPDTNAINGLAYESTVKSYLKITVGNCETDDGSSCKTAEANQLDAPYQSVIFEASIVKPTPVFSIQNTDNNNEVNEDETATFRISVDQDPAGLGIQNITVLPTVTGHDFLVSSWGTHNVNKDDLPVSGFTSTGGGSYSKDYQMPINGETGVYSGDGTIKLTLVAVQGMYDIHASDYEASVTVKDTTPAPEVRFNDDSLSKSVNEGVSVELQISTTGGTAQDVTVNYAINPGTQNPASATDYSDSNNGRATISSTTGTGTISIDIATDSDDSEPDETFQVVLGSASMGSLDLQIETGKETSTVTISTAPTTPVLSIENTSAADRVVNEGEMVMFRISLDKNPADISGSPTTFAVIPTFSEHNFLISSWTAGTSRTVNFSDLSQSNGSGPYSTVYQVPTNSGEADVYSGNGTIILTLETPPNNAGYEIDSGKASASVTVMDTTSAPKVQFDGILTHSVNEGLSVDLTISTTGRTAQDVTVNYAFNTTFTDTAINPASNADYSDANNGVVTIDSTTGKGIVSIQIASDSDEMEPDESFKVDLSSASMGSLDLEIETSRQTSTVTISVETIEPRISMTVSASGVSEGEMINFTVQVSPPPQNSVTVPMKVSVGGNSRNAILWAPSVAIVPVSGSATYSISTLDNSDVTGPVTVSVSMYDVSGYDVDEGAVQTVTIADNDRDGAPNPSVTYSVAGQVITSVLTSEITSPAEPVTHAGLMVPDVSISAVDSVVAEGSAIEFQIESSAPVENALQVRVGLNGTEGIISGNLERIAVIPSGQTRSLLTVDTLDDRIAELYGKVTAALLENADYSISNPNSATATVSVKIDRGLHEMRLSEANRTVLPQVLTTMRAVSMNATTEHLTMSMNGEVETKVSLGGRDSFGDLVMTGMETLNGDWENIRSEIGNSSFVLNLFPEEGMSSPATVWGVSEVKGLSGNRSSSNHVYQGEMFAGQVGFTVRTGNGIIAGLSTDVSESEVKYGNDSENLPEIDYKTTMSGIQPYFGYSSPDGISQVRVITGYGLGEVGIDQKGYAIEYLDSSFVSSRMSGHRKLLQNNIEQGGIVGELKLTGDAWTVHQSVESNDAGIPGLQTFANHFRFATEGHQQFPLSEFGTLIPSAEAAVRGGNLDSDSVFGFETAAGFDFNSAYGIALSNSARAFMSPDIPETQWELKSSLKYDGGFDDIGLQFELSPVWGGMDSDITNSFQNDYPLMIKLNSDSPDRKNDFRLDTEVAYGISIMEYSSMLKPYVRYSTEDFLHHELSAGYSVNIGQVLQVNFVTKRITNEFTVPEDGVNLSGTMTW